MTFLKRVFILSTVTLIAGVICYFIFPDHWVKYIFIHIGALGLLGLLACIAGGIAEKKGLNYKRAVYLLFFSSLFLGIVIDYIVDPPRENGLPSSCGGIVSLGVASIVVVIYLLQKKSNNT